MHAPCQTEVATARGAVHSLTYTPPACTGARQSWPLAFTGNLVYFDIFADEILAAQWKT